MTLKKLFVNGISCSVFLFGSLVATSQINYTDIIPDTQIIAPNDAWGTYNVDLDHDGTDDFMLNHHNMKISSNYQKIEMINLHDKAEILCENATGHYPLALNQGDAINSASVTWYCSPGMMIILNDNCTDGNWIGKTNNYLGVRIKKGGLWYYGWICLGVPADAGSYTVKDFAYNTTADQSIQAGQTGTGISAFEKKYQSFSVISTSNGSETRIICKNVTDEKVGFTLYSINGAVIFEADFKPQSLIEIPVSEFQRGIYLFMVRSSEERISGRIFLQ